MVKRNNRSRIPVNQTILQGILLELARQISGDFKLDTVLRSIAREACDFLDAYGTAIYTLSDNEESLIPVVEIEAG